MMTNSHSNYRPDIDWIRAVAVLAVVARANAPKAELARGMSLAPSLNPEEAPQVESLNRVSMSQL